MPEALSGVIERITFHNLDNGYCVLRVQARGHRDLVTVVGHLSQAVAGEFVEASGDWATDRQHGPQFKAAELRTVPPHTAEGIARYLGSGLVKGIGPKFAAKIVDVFGDKTLEVIDQSPAFLSQVKGVGPKRIELIRQSWRQNQAVHKIMSFLQSFGVGTARAVKIYKTYGDTAIDLVRHNPYRLSTDIWGVGFRTADDLALKLGIAADSPKRAQAAVRHVLQEGSSNGHVGLPPAVVVEQTVALTNIASEGIEAAIVELRTADEVVLDGGEGSQSLLYLKPLYLAEVGIARSVKHLQSGRHPMPAIDVEKAVGWVEKKMGITFADAQREAVRQAITQKVMVLTGGPGTGKTTIVRAILEIFAAKGRQVGLCAPTGRAAKRLAESTGREAKTVHRLLEYDAAIGGFRRTGNDSQLELDLIVIDETSMLDVSLAHHLLRAVPAEACVLFVGDGDQLPSVGPGCVLADLIESGVVPVVRLNEVHRQASSSWIVRAAHSIHHGEVPESAPAGQGDFYFVEVDDPPAVIDRVIAMVKDRIPAAFGLNPLRDVQVLAPMNRGELGVGNLNQALQAALNPGGGGEVARYGTTFRLGDKVIQTRNDYQKDVFNGDIGRIAEIDQTEQVVTVEFDGRGVPYEFGDLDELQLAYCTSIHKSQGSEYPAVVIPLHTQHFVLLQRNLLYTAVTRGRKLVAVVGSRKALWLAVTRADQSRRFSLLAWRLRQG